MATLQVTSNIPVRIPPIEGRARTVKNLGSAVIIYGTEQGVSESLKTGELAEGASVTISVPMYFIAKPPTRVGTNLLGTTAAILEVTQTGTQLDRLPEGSVSDADVSSLSSSKIAGSGSTVTTPTPGAEKAVVLGTAGVARKLTAVHTGDGAETKVKVKHSFETEAVDVVVQKGAETGKPGENYLNAAGAGNVTWKPISLSEIEVTFGTAPIAKFQSFITVLG